MVTTTYIHQTPEFLRYFDGFTFLSRCRLGNTYGKGFVNTVLERTRREFQDLIPQIPYIGSRSLFKNQLVTSAAYLGLCRTLDRLGWDMGEMGRFMHIVHDSAADHIPGCLRRLAGGRVFQRATIRSMEQATAQSQLRRYPGDWVFKMVYGSGKEFEYGYDVTECGVLKFYQSQDAADLTPYVCALDHFQADRFGFTVLRQGTLAGGAACCDCRFKRKWSPGQWPPKYPMES